jgi:chaperonin GroES
MNIVPCPTCGSTAIHACMGPKKKSKSKENSMKIIPLGNNILVRRAEAVKQTPGGLYIPDRAQATQQEGEVLAVGSGKMLENGTRTEFSVKPGDCIIFTAYAGSEVVLGKEKYLILSEDEVLAVKGINV